MLSGIALSAVHSPTVPSLEHDLFSLATLGTEACDAVGDAFRPQWRERPAKEFRRISSQRHPRECRRLRRLHSYRVARRPCGRPALSELGVKVSLHRKETRFRNGKTLTMNPVMAL